MRPWFLPTVLSCSLIFMCVLLKHGTPLDFVLPVCFIMDHAKCLRRIKRAFVNMFLLQDRAMSWEEGGISGRIMEYFHLFYVILSAT